ncbi:MAG: hypothetical protein L0229_08090 [Blastocatellia bacterium]|nr:hypothetical protein [Blastocatellia bacterium]
MTVDYLVKLNESVESLLKQKSILEKIQELKEEIGHAQESFVWSVIDLNSVKSELPENIESGWIFVLKKDVPSGRHYHPNSIQHMVMLEGQGKARIAETSKRMIRYGLSDRLPDETWYVIGEGIPHEFFPEERDMVVISFHTCEAKELEEVDCETGVRRLYEGE